MFIKSVNNDVKDIFLGKGWDNHVRITRNGDTFLRTSGMHLSPDVLTKISSRIKSFEEQASRKLAGVYHHNGNQSRQS